MSCIRCPQRCKNWSLSRHFSFCNCLDRNTTPGANGILLFVSRVFSRRPFVILFLTLTLAGILTKFGVSEYGFPEFEDPYLGFETRFTPIANRLIALENLRKEVNGLGMLENYPGERLMGKEWRKKRQTEKDGEMSELEEEDDPFGGGGYCNKIPLDDYSRIALEIKPSYKVFSKEIVMLICYFQKLTEVLSQYTARCEHNGNGECCQMWSLPNYISDYTNKTDCSTIKDSDIKLFEEDMNFCRELFKNPEEFEACTLKHERCPVKCHRDEPLYSAMFLTIDKSYTTGKDVKYSMVILPIAKSHGSRGRTELLQNAILNVNLPEDYVFLSGYDFGDKDWMFKVFLIQDLKYVLIGSVVIFLIVCFYAKSFCVTAISFLALTLSLGVSYFLYVAVFRIPYFPFMNMLVTIIVMGIGTDGTLILGSEWQRLKSKHKNPDQKIWDEMMVSLLEETTGPLFVTSCTTAGAFFASLMSSITTIRCFSIFAGTSILTGFILLYICVPTSLLLCDLCCSYLHSLFFEPEDSRKISSKLIKIFQSLHFNFTIPEKSKKFISSYKTLVWVVSFTTLACILVWSSIVVFYYPQFQLPNSEQFQLLSTNHPIEKFDREVEPQFPGSFLQNEDNGDKLTVYFVWGVNPIDTGYGLDPNDNGQLQLDSNFLMKSVQSQKWMRKLCSKIRKQSFYDQVANSVVGAHYDSCFMDTMVKWMKRDCDPVFDKNVTYKPCCKISKFPYEPQVFTKCMEMAARDVYRTPSLYFQPDIAGPKFIVLRDGDKEGQLATFTLRFRTNVSYSLSYEKMQTFYNELETFFNKDVLGSKIPTELGTNGFFISAHLDFFDLQNSLLTDTSESVFISAALCFIFIWIFSRSFSIAVGAVLTIFSIVIVSSAVLIQLFNWKLGVFESIAVTVAVGLSDFTAHHALEYAKRQSVLKVTSATFFSALTTITIGLSMLLFSSVLVYQQIGAFFTVLIIVSWLYSVFFLSPILETFDKIQDLFTSVCRMYCMDRPSTSFTNSIIYSNPMTSNSSSGRQNDSMDDLDGQQIGATKIPTAIIEEVKLLKKVGAETSV